MYIKGSEVSKAFKDIREYLTNKRDLIFCLIVNLGKFFRKLLVLDFGILSKMNFIKIIFTCCFLYC